MPKQPEFDDGNLPRLIRDWIARYAEPSEPAPITAPVIAFYLRRSSADPQYLSISAQLSLCGFHARLLGEAFDHEPLLFVDRHRSGSTTTGREGLAKLLEAARAGKFRVLFVRSICRLTRNAADAARLHEVLAGYGVSIHVAGRGEVQHFEIILLALSAQRERERMLQTLMDGKRRSAQRGGMFGSWSTYGYDRIEGPDWRINCEESSIIRRCFNEVDAGSTLSEVCRRLNIEHMPSPRGGIWVPETLMSNGYGVLQRPIVKGVLVWGVKTRDPVILHRPDLAIVEADVFDRVNARFGTREKTPRITNNEPFLQGRLRCACGNSMRVTEDGGTRSIFCVHARIGGSCDRTRGLNFSILARQVLLHFRHVVLDEVPGRLLEEERRREWNGLAAAVQTERDRLTTRTADIAKEIDALAIDATDEIYPAITARCCELELEHHGLAERLTRLVVPEFREVNWGEAEIDRAGMLRMLERMPRISRSREDLRAIALIRGILSEIELDISEEGYRVRFRYGVPDAPKGFEPYDRSGDCVWSRFIPHPSPGPLRYPEVLMGHHRRAEAGAFEIDDGDWAAIEPIFEDVPRLRPGGRLAAEAVLFVALTGLSTKYLPERYAPFASGMTGLGAPGRLWPRLYAILAERRSPLVADVGPALPTPGKRPHRRLLPHPVPPLEDPSTWSDRVPRRRRGPIGNPPPTACPSSDGPAGSI